MTTIYYLGILILGLLIYYFLFAFSFFRKKMVIPAYLETEVSVNYFNGIVWYKSLNLGALVYTPAWLFINGFWLLLITYFIFLAIYWPVSVGISFLLFLFGSRLSWGRGRRWNNNIERFLNLQSGLSFLVFINIIIFLLLSINISE